jgi:4-carboxymuconolactone decarboxylase
VERRLILIAALAAAGRFDEMAEAVRAAHDDGVSAAAIREAIVFLVPYAGWPTALNALLAAGAVVPLTTGVADPLDTADRAARRELGLATARRVNDRFDRVAENLAAIDPALVDLLAEGAYGYVYNRTGLDLVQRELLAVAILAVQGHDRQLLYHLRGAANVGATPDDITGAIETLGDISEEVRERGRRAWNDLYRRLNP